jgi:AcrR family transcriptional regulator
MPKLSSTLVPSAADAATPVRRILAVVRERLFTYGYNALTMDVLAHELGMSKKTLYVHFPSKDTIIGAIIDEIGTAIRTRMDVVLSDPKLTFTQKLCSLNEIVGSNLAKASPGMLHDLQRFAPALYQKIDEVRQRNVPHVFGRLIRAGIAEGMVRPEIDPDFAVEFWLQAMRGLTHPAVLDRTQLSPSQTLEKAIKLFFGGLLTAAGHRDYENHHVAYEKHSAS